MKPITIIFTIGICMILLASTCNPEDENCHKAILIVNNSDGGIYFQTSALYPDTMTLYPNPSSAPGYFKIESHTSKSDINRSCIEDILKTTPEEKIMYFIYDAHTLETTPWDTVRKNYMILKRYDLSLGDLERMNWTITYP